MKIQGNFNNYGLAWICNLKMKINSVENLIELFSLTLHLIF